MKKEEYDKKSMEINKRCGSKSQFIKNINKLREKKTFQDFFCLWRF